MNRIVERRAEQTLNGQMLVQTNSEYCFCTGKAYVSDWKTVNNTKQAKRIEMFRGGVSQLMQIKLGQL